jgi:hypothetical protein
VRLFYGCAFSDLCYGYIGFWSKHVNRLACDRDGFEIETLINVRALKNKLKIVEVASFESSLSATYVRSPMDFVFSRQFFASG